MSPRSDYAKELQETYLLLNKMELEMIEQILIIIECERRDRGSPRLPYAAVEGEEAE